jgi:hypothetical protein
MRSSVEAQALLVEHFIEAFIATAFLLYSLAFTFKNERPLTILPIGAIRILHGRRKSIVLLLMNGFFFLFLAVAFSWNQREAELFDSFTVDELMTNPSAYTWYPSLAVRVHANKRVSLSYDSQKSAL